MKENLQKILKRLKNVSDSFRLFKSFGSLRTLVALTMILCLSNIKAQDVSLLGSWTAGTTKAKEAGSNRLLVVAVTGEISVMNNLTDISLTYGGQVMNKVVYESIGTTGFGNFSYIFTLNEAGIAAADETGTIVPTWTTTAPAGSDIFSAFYSNVDQTTPVSDTSEFNINNDSVFAPAVNAALGDMVLMSVAFSGQPRTPTYPSGFTEILRNPNSQSWGSGIIADKAGDGTAVLPNIINSSGERAALTAVVLKKAKVMVKTPVVLLDSWTAGTVKPKAAGTKRLLVAAVTGEISVMNNLTDIGLTYGGQPMNKVVFESIGTTGFGNFSYIFTLNEAGITAADETGTLVPTWTTTAPAGFDIFSAFYDKVDQTTPVSDTSEFNINAALVTAPAVAAAFGDVVLMSVAFSGQPRTPTYTTGFTEVLKNPNSQSWGSGIIAYKDGDGTEVIPSITNSASERAALTAIVLQQGEEEGVPPVYYNLTVNVGTGGTVKIDPNRVKYLEGTVVKVKATPNFGYYFVNWTDSINGIVTDTSSIVMNSDKTVTANFAEKTKYTITTEVSDGSILLNPAGGTYYEGVEVTVLVKANVGFEFKGWGGDLSGMVNPQKVVVDSNMTISATIEEIPAFTLTLTAGSNGAVTWSPKKATYEPGEAVVLIATGDDGYRFAEWSGDLTTKENPTSIIMDGDKNITASFELIPPSYTLSVEAAHGTVTLDPPGGTYDEGTVVTVTVSADNRYLFDSWSGDLTGSTNPATVTVSKDMSISASFASIYTLSVVAEHGTVTLNPSGGAYKEGTEVTLTVAADDLYKFDAWGWDLSGTENPATITVTKDVSVTALFSLKTGVNNLNVPEETALAQIFPNPISETAQISYQLNQDSKVKLAVFNVLGEQVATLVNDKRAAGYYTIEWNTEDGNGVPVVNGIYIFRLDVDGFAGQYQKAILSR